MMRRIAHAEPDPESRQVNGLRETIPVSDVVAFCLRTPRREATIALGRNLKAKSK